MFQAGCMGQIRFGKQICQGPISGDTGGGNLVREIILLSDLLSSANTVNFLQNFGCLRRYSSRHILNSMSNTHGGPALTTLPTRLRSFVPSLTRSSSESVRTWLRYSSSSNSRNAIGL